VALPALFVWHDVPRITPALPDPPATVVLNLVAECVVGNANINDCSSEEKMVAKPKKRAAGNVKMKKRILKAEADGDTERLAALRFKRSGCQKDKKRALALGIALQGLIETCVV
jgi:hypothetical protein